MEVQSGSVEGGSLQPVAESIVSKPISTMEFMPRPSFPKVTSREWLCMAVTKIVISLPLGVSSDICSETSHRPGQVCLQLELHFEAPLPLQFSILMSLLHLSVLCHHLKSLPAYSAPTSSAL